MKKIIVFTALALFVSLSTVVSAQIVNGSFEEGTPLAVDGPGFFTASSGDIGSIFGWTVSSGSVDYIGSYWQASEASRSIDLNGFEKGSISQTLTTTAGWTYTITFSMSGNPDGVADDTHPYFSPAEKKMSVTAAAGTPQTYTYTTGANTLDDMQYATHTFSFTATGASTELVIASEIQGAFGPVVDNVRITEVTGQICHRDFGKPKVKTLTVGVAAIPAHVAHGDTAGPCPIAP